MGNKIKEYKDIMMRKENQIIRETQIYCAKNDVDFSRKHNILMRNAIRQFFKEAVHPIVRDIWENGIKDYAKD